MVQIVESNPKEFNLTRELTDRAINSLVRLAISRLLEKDSPSLETLKMQVGFDSVYVSLEEDLGRRARTRAERGQEMQRAIVGVLPRSGSDFDALTGLYRMIFAYLMAHYDPGRDFGGKLTGTMGAPPSGPKPGEKVCGRVFWHSSFSRPAP